MNCRTARAHMTQSGSLAPDQQRAYQQHLAACLACREEQDNSFSQTLVQTTREMALPPPNFTATLRQRLPAESPLALARSQRRRRQSIVLSMVAAATMLLGIAVALQPLWAGTTLGLAAQALLVIVAAAIQPLAVMLASGLVVALLLDLVVRRPSAGRALGAAALALLLLGSAGVVTITNDAANTSSLATGSASAATILQPIQVTQATRGDVATLLGDIVVSNVVAGNVASFAGTITLRPTARVGGDVLAGSGQLQAGDQQIAGEVRPATGALVVGTALLGTNTTTLSPTMARSLGALLGALVTLILAGLAVLLWPERTLRTSQVLPQQPWTALGLGVMITVLLVLLAMPLLALLAATVAGLLLVPLLLLVVHLPYVQGLAAVGQALGQRLTGTATSAGAVWGVAVQLVLVLGLGMWAPFAGMTIFYLLASLGLGGQILARRWLA